MGFHSRAKYWELCAANLTVLGWTWGFVSLVDENGRKLFLADAHRDRRRFVVRSDELLTAFVELESMVRRDV